MYKLFREWPVSERPRSWALLWGYGEFINDPKYKDDPAVSVITLYVRCGAVSEATVAAGSMAYEI